ncbi:uncharacterized protein Dana_GF27084 [Drosophila ananassae]|uniref:Gamma tubulin complex component C-terminal domain-containing protein n=1 Tax=Drosophila ananassae TaxID=7217 RepID=A0A0N8NZ05_DROAN|nr:uncharacterized protein LOC26514493 [Drosophila ananassae]KPU72980.1 uncharacterized protein Dana_GF27084 [Drosophila ananassae]
MDYKPSSKIALFQDAIDCLAGIKLPQSPPKDIEQNGYDVFMGICELSASLGNFSHNVPNTMKFLAENRTQPCGSYELVLLNNFRKEFEHHQMDPDKETRMVHEARGNLFMHLYKELVDIEPEENQRLQYMQLCYELIDIDRPKNCEEDRIELINRLLVQVQNLMQRLQERSLDDPDSGVRGTDSLIDMYLASKNLMLDSKMESIRNLHGVKNGLSLPLRGISFEKGIAVIHNQRLTIAAELRHEDINLKLVNSFSDDLIVAKKSNLHSEISLKDLSSSISSPNSSDNEATTPEDIFEDFLENNFICDSKEVIADLDVESVFEDCSSKGFDMDVIVNHIFSKNENLGIEISEESHDSLMVLGKAQLLGTLATSSEDDVPPLIDFSQEDDSDGSSNIIERNSKREGTLWSKVLRELDSSSEEDLKMLRPPRPQESQVKESLNIMEEAKGAYKIDSSKQSGLEMIKMVSEESISQVASLKKINETLSDIKASIAYPKIKVKWLSACPKITIHDIPQVPANRKIIPMSLTISGEDQIPNIRAHKDFPVNVAENVSQVELNNVSNRQATICFQNKTGKYLSTNLETIIEEKPEGAIDSFKLDFSSKVSRDNSSSLLSFRSDSFEPSSSNEEKQATPRNGIKVHTIALFGNLKRIQNLFSNFNNRIVTMEDGSESSDSKVNKNYSHTSLESIEPPVIGCEEYLNEEIPHLEIDEKFSSRSPSIGEKNKRAIRDSKKSLEDDEEPLSPILSKISQTLSETRLNVLKQVDKSLTELQKKSLLPEIYSEEECGSQEAVKRKNALQRQTCFVVFPKDTVPVREIYKNATPSTASKETHENTIETVTLERPVIENFDKQSPREILKNIKQTASDIKINILKTMDKSLSALTSSSEISEVFTELSPKISPNQSWVEKCEEPVSEEIPLLKTTMDSLKEICVKSDGGDQMEDCKQISKLTTSIVNDFIVTATGSFSETLKNETVLDSQGLKSKSDRNSQDLKSKSDRKSDTFPKWQHQSHIIAAPRVIVPLLKSKSICERSAQDGNGLSFFEQLEQFFEIMNMENCSLAAEINVTTIQARLGKLLCRIKTQLPNELSHSDLVAAVGKYQLKHLLTRQERISYESVRWQLRDTGQESFGKTKFEAALYGMLGYESSHLKATDGRLHMRLPHHQESIGESYLMVAFGHLGHLYRSLQDQLEGLSRRGETANAIRKCLQKELLSFYDLYHLRKNQPCSLLQLYRETRVYQLRFQWLLDVLQKVNNRKSILVCLINELDLRVGAQRLLIQNWLNSASKPLVARFCRWLISGNLTPLDRDEFLIDRYIASTTYDFWQNRYTLTDTFSSVFDSKLSEMIMSIGKTQVYSQKYLGLQAEISISLKDLYYKLREVFNQFYEDRDQEPLYKLVSKLHHEVSGRVLRYLRQMKSEPENLFQNIHHYVMLADRRFCRELTDILEPVLEEPSSFYNTNLLNQMMEQMFSKPLPDLYVGEATSEGSKCWSRFLLRWQFPDYWAALLGEQAQEYEVIFMGLWKFHYTNYVLRERIARQQYHFSKRLELQSFDGLAEADECLGKLIKSIYEVMKVLRSYFLHEVLEQAYVKLVQGCKGAQTLDDLRKANRTYLQDIKVGWFQTQSSHKAIHYLERIFSFILDLESQQQKFFRLTQILLDSVIEDCGRRKSKSSKSHTNLMQEFRWSCQNTCEALKELEERFHLAMIDFLFSLHLGNRQSFRLLAQKLDFIGYYEGRDQRLWLIQRFGFKRKARMVKSDGHPLQ